jgi:hypothetical protein
MTQIRRFAAAGPSNNGVADDPRPLKIPHFAARLAPGHLRSFTFSRSFDMKVYNEFVPHGAFRTMCRIVYVIFCPAKLD